jgi:hypothetical protein
MRGQYTVVTPEQDQEAVYFDMQTWDVIVTSALRAEIESLNITEIGWESAAVFDRPLPEHEIPSIPPSA